MRGGGDALRLCQRRWRRHKEARSAARYAHASFCRFRHFAAELPLRRLMPRAAP
jgi:hypothetical protein